MALNDWEDGAEGGTPLSAARLNERDTAIVDAAKTATWGQVSNRPTTFPPTIGTTATTAAAGDHTHDAADVSVDVEGITATDVAGALAELLALIGE